jgi:hypothetical protein
MCITIVICQKKKEKKRDQRHKKQETRTIDLARNKLHVYGIRQESIRNIHYMTKNKKTLRYYYVNIFE